MEISVNESAAYQQNRFMADLTQAMRSSAESSQLSDVEQCQADAKAYVEQLHLRTLDESQELRQEAEADVATIRERSRVRVERVRQETEQRLSRRRELLDQELAEFHAAIELEIESVQERVEAFQTEVSQFFEQLLQGADPTVFATMASKMPDPPAFADLDREAFASELRAKRERAERAAGGEPVEADLAPAVPATPDASDAPPSADSSGEPGAEPRGRWWTDSRAGRAARGHAEETR